MKKKLVLMCIAAGLVMAALVGSTAASFKSTVAKTNETITINEIGVALAASVEDETVVGIEVPPVVPGDEIELNDYFVSNPMNEEDYSIYVKVTMYKQWNRDELVAEMVRFIYGDDDDIESDLADWVIVHEDDEQTVLVYRKPLAPGEKTNAFLKKLSFSPYLDNEYADATLTVSVRVDAVQKNVADKAIVAEWGLYPEFDADGNITAIDE